MFFIPPLIAAILVVLIPLVFIIWDSPRKVSVLITAGILVVLYTILGIWPVAWFFKPVMGLNWETFFHSIIFWIVPMILAAAALWFAGSLDEAKAADRSRGRYGRPLNEESINLGGIVFAVVMTIFVIGAVANGATSSIWTTEDGKTLANQIKVDIQEQGEYPDTASDHISYVPEQTARLYAGQAMNSSSIANLSSAYAVGTPVRQSVQNHVYWIAPLSVASWNSYAFNGIKTVPAFVAVDAENPSANAKVHDKNADGSPIAIKYVLGGPLESNLERHVWGSGFSGVPVEDWTLEVDDQWRPYWTATINRNTLGFARTVPAQVITVDAQTGDIKTYPLDKVPSWIDRIYSEADAVAILNWWGDFHQNELGFMGIGRGPQDRFHVHGHATLVYTKEEYPVWQMQLASMNNDASVAYLALFDGRQGKVRLYQIPDMQVEEKVAEGIAKNTLPARNATDLAVHKVHGQLAWVAPLIPVDSGDKAAVQGVALVPVNRPAAAETIALGTSMNDALAAFDIKQAGSSSAKPSEDATAAKATGTVTNLTHWDEGGKTSRYFMLTDDNGVLDNKSIYVVTFVPSQPDANAEKAIIREGAKVVVSYAETQGVRTVRAYDDLGIG